MEGDWEGEVVHEGWLTKSPPLETKTRQIFSQTLIQPKWRRRWFQLRAGAMPGQFVLQYYVDTSRRRLKGSIDLDQCEQVDSGLTFECGKVSFQYMFDIRTPRRVYYLAADTEEDMATWVDLVCRVCGLHNYTHESTGHSREDSGCGEAQEEAAVTRQPQHISGPYMHLSECFTGAGAGAGPRAASVETASTCTSYSRGPVLEEAAAHLGDDSVFLPSSPAPAHLHAPAAQMAGLSLGGPGRPPKPSNLRRVELSYPSSGHSGNYENHEEFAVSSPAFHQHQQQQQHTKVETNNNCDSAAPFQPPTVDRTLKPERAVLSPAATQGPPVERSRKPRQLSAHEAAHTWHGGGEGLVVPRGMSIPGTDLGNTWEDASTGGGSEGGSLHGSSEEQIYFYMPSLNTASHLATPGGRWDPIMIPASELRDNAVQYLDLDLPPTDTSLVEAGGSVGLPDRSSARMRGGETVYKTVDFVKTEAFNRTRQKVEEYKYNIKHDK